MRTQYSVWSNFLKSFSYRPVLFPNSVIAEDMRRPNSVWCIFPEKKFLQICFFSNSVIAEDMRRSYSVWCNFSRNFFYRPVLILIQYSQRACDGQFQGDTITLDKSLTFLSFLLNQFLQRTCERNTQSEATFSKVLRTDLFFFLIQ